jgi:chemotaxis protein MotB
MKYDSLQNLGLLLVGSALLVTSGCVKKDEYNAVVAERDELMRIVEEQNAVLNELEGDFDRLAEIFAEEIANQQIALEQLVDGIEVEIPSDVMYESGSATATVGSEGLEYAAQLAEFLKGTDYFVSVIGHTDNQKVSRNLAKRYPSNWELAGARAASAVRYFVAQGVDPTRMVASSRGHFDPVASNDTPEGRAENRRIEIVLRSLPK